MTGAAHVDPAVIAEVAQSLLRYGAAEESVFRQADGAVRATSGRVQQEQARRRQALAGAQAALQACQQQEHADCSVFNHAVREAQIRLDAANQAMRQVTAAVARYQPAKARHSATVQGLLLGARTHLGRKADEIESYLAAAPGGSGGGGGGGGAAAWGTALSIAKAVAWELGPTIVTNTLSDVTTHPALFDALGDVIGPALSAVREPGAFKAGVAMTSEAGYRALGSALTYVLEHLDV